MNRALLPESIGRTRVIAVLRRLGIARVRDIAPVLSDAGIENLEVTMDGEEALESICWLEGQGYEVGAGTVRTAGQAEAAHQAGASFLVSPSCDVALIAAVVEQNIPFIPGTLTPTEITVAWDLGVSAVKLFPASIGGPDYLRSIQAPLAGIPLIPTGGINDANAASYLDAGAVAVGVGGWLTGPDDLDEIARRATSLRHSVKG